MNNAVFRKTMENVRNHSNIKHVTTEARRYHTTKKCSDNLLVIEIKRTWILINKPVYLGLSSLQMSKIVMYDYMKPKYLEKAELLYIDTDSFIVYIKHRRYLHKH